MSCASAPKELPRELMADPVAWFFLEHERHRQFCRVMETAAAAKVFDPDLLAQLLDFMRNELARHIVDEEEDLFPLLRRRALPDDHIDEVLHRLAAEHKTDADQGRIAREQLQACLRLRRAPRDLPDARAALEAFAAQEMRHLALENAVVLPIARLRLTPTDLRRLSRRLAQRRGAPSPVA